MGLKLILESTKKIKKIHEAHNGSSALDIIN